MAQIALEGFYSTGHDGWPPTQSVGPYTSTAFIGGMRIQLRGYTRYAAHKKRIGNNDVWHYEEDRVVVDPGDSTFFMEGVPMAMVGDQISDGDFIAPGESFGVDI